MFQDGVVSASLGDKWEEVENLKKRATNSPFPAGSPKGGKRKEQGQAENPVGQDGMGYILCRANEGTHKGRGKKYQAVPKGGILVSKGLKNKEEARRWIPGRMSGGQVLG